MDFAGFGGVLEGFGWFGMVSVAFAFSFLWCFSPLWIVGI